MLLSGERGKYELNDNEISRAIKFKMVQAMINEVTFTADCVYK